jgi:hypothetical protein
VTAQTWSIEAVGDGSSVRITLPTPYLARALERFARMNYLRVTDSGPASAGYSWLLVRGTGTRIGRTSLRISMATLCRKWDEEMLVQIAEQTFVLGAYGGHAAADAAIRALFPRAPELTAMLTDEERDGPYRNLNSHGIDAMRRTNRARPVPLSTFDEDVRATVSHLMHTVVEIGFSEDDLTIYASVTGPEVAHLEQLWRSADHISRWDLLNTWHVVHFVGSVTSGPPAHSALPHPDTLALARTALEPYWRAARQERLIYHV